MEGNSKAQGNERAVQNKAADKKQFQRYQAVLGDDATKNLDAFQQMKYHDAEEWEELRLQYSDEKLKASIRNGKHNLTINPEKQERHMMGAPGYIPGRSMIAIPVEDLQNYVLQSAGTGEIQRTDSGKWRDLEIVEFPDEIGFVVKEDGTQLPTSVGKIHYSKTGVHVVPFVKGK